MTSPVLPQGKSTVRRFTALLTFLCTVSLVGCGGGQAPPPPVAEIHLKKLTIIYGRFLMTSKGKTPKDEAEFKTFAKKMSLADLGSIGVTDGNVDAIFISPRDQQAYVVRYNDPGASSGPGGPQVIAHEKTGQGGKKLVAFINTEVKELTDAEFTPIKPR